MNAPAPRRDDELILEGIVTTCNEDGSINVSPMGPVVDRSISRIRLRPFNTSTTYRNLARKRVGVFHVTDDVELLARAATRSLDAPPELLAATATGSERFGGMVIASSCRWYGFEVIEIDDANERVEIETTVRESGRLRDFFGWNRAMHAVLEAAILATRIDLLGIEEIQKQLKPLATIVEKTASQEERNAFDIIEAIILNEGQTEL